MGLVKRKIVFFYDFLPRSTTFALWRTAKTWMQPSTKTKDTSEPSNETVFDEKTVHGRKQMYKWECKAARRAFFCTTSQALRASSPGRKDSLRPEGDVANSDRGRTATGEPVVAVLDELGEAVTEGDGEGSSKPPKIPAYFLFSSAAFACYLLRGAV